MTRYVNHCNCIHIAVHMGTWISSNFLFWAKKLLRSQASKLIVTKWKHTLHMHQRFFKTWCHWKNVIATTLSKASLTVDLHLRHCFAMTIYILHSCVPWECLWPLDLLFFIGDWAVCLWWIHLHLHICIFT